LSRLPRYEFNREYVERLVAEDPETERHFTDYFKSLLSLKLRSRLRSKALVEDATQETFARVLATLKQKGGLTSPETLGAFVNSVCNNVLFELYRSGSRTVPLETEHDPPSEASSVESTIVAAEEHQRVRAVLAGLPRREQDLLKWLFFDNRDKDDICWQLNVDRNYLRVLLHRAKMRFRDGYVGDGTP
jgi:RNA polymerase sigma-70 factor (ECF subfamily)